MRSRLHRRYGKRRDRARSGSGSEPRRNPPLMSDLVEWVGPGFASFAATRFATRVAATQIAKRKPSWGKHAGAGVSIGAFLAAWFLGHRLKWLGKYHTPITVGAAIAALQSLIQLYIPKLGWMVSDASPELAAAEPTADPLSVAAAQHQLRPVNEDPNEYTYNDSYDAGRYSPAQQGAGGGSDGVDPADLQVDDMMGQSANLGVFSN